MANEAATANAAQDRSLSPRLKETIAITSAGTTYSGTILFSAELEEFQLEVAVNLSAVTGGTFDVTPQISYDGGGTWFEKTVAGVDTFTQWAGGAPSAKTLTITDGIGKQVRFKFVAGAGVTNVAGQIFAFSRKA